KSVNQSSTNQCNRARLRRCKYNEKQKCSDKPGIHDQSDATWSFTHMRAFGNQSRDFERITQKGTYHVGKQQSIQWIRGAGHREGEKVLQPDVASKDVGGPWPAHIASVRRQ